MEQEQQQESEDEAVASIPSFTQYIVRDVIEWLSYSIVHDRDDEEKERMEKWGALDVRKMTMK